MVALVHVKMRDLFRYSARKSFESNSHDSNFPGSTSFYAIDRNQNKKTKKVFICEETTATYL